ncbi:MAG TPA: fibronectin type III domain-containing protein [Puia sp.]|jgi:predicted esterase
MKTFTLFTRLLLIVMASVAGLSAYSQKAMDPTDPVITYNSAAPPALPNGNAIGKWVRTVRMSYNTDEYKCYIYQKNQFRLHFPKSYNPTANDGKKYPILVFYHGDGETGTMYDNENQLVHGGDIFQAMVDNGTFDGYVLMMQTQFGWGSANYSALKDIEDSLVANYKGDPYHIVSNGLSNGAQGTWESLVAYPTYFAGAVPMSGVYPVDGTTAVVNTLKYTPIWNLDGGLDNNPPPAQAASIYSVYAAAGANYVYKNYVTLGHDTWDSTWQEPNFWPFVNAAYLSNPWALGGRTKFCPGDNISVTLGIVPGLAGYKWRLNGVVIPNASSNTYIATQPGVYDASVLKGSTWSDWSHTPVTIVVQTASITPPITVAGVASVVLPDAGGKNSVTLTEVAGDSAYAWQMAGSNTVIGNQQTLNVTTPGSYIATVTPKFSCSSVPSTPFVVVSATGPNPPSAATSLFAVQTGNTAARLTWTANPHPVNPVTAYEIYRGTKTGVYQFVGQVVKDSLAYTDVSLSPNVTYYYAIRAVNTSGAAPLSNESSTTTASDKTPPTAPVGLAVISSSNTSVTLSWTAATDNVNVDHYAVYRNGTLVNVTTNLNFIVNALTTGQLYTFYVKAVDGSGNYSTQSNQVSAPALFNGLTYNYYNTATSLGVLPDFTTMTPATTGTMPNVSISGAPATTNFAYTWTGFINIPVSGTYFFATTSDDGSALWFNKSAPGSISTATVNNDGAHASQTITSAGLVLTPGVYPITIAYFQAGGGFNMSISWACKALFGNTTQVAIDNKYFAANYTPAGTAPVAPTLVTATATSYNKVTVSWKDNSTNETGFEVYRTTAASGTYQIVGTTGAGATSFKDSALSPSTLYYYKVQAINQYGVSGFDPASTGGINWNLYQGSWANLPIFTTLTPVSSGIMSNVSLTPAAPLTSNFGMLFSGSINIPTAGKYTFYTSSDDASDLYIDGYNTAHLVVNNDFQQGNTERSGTITLTKGSHLFYVSYDQGGGDFVLTTSWAGPGITKSIIPDSVFANKSSSTTTLALPAAPVAPSSVAGTALSTSKIRLTWQDTSSTVTSFTLYRSLGDSLHFNTLAAGLAPGVFQYTDSSLFGRTTYYYKLTATSAGGTSAYSAAKGIVTLDNAPVFAALANVTMKAGNSITIPITATDPDGDTVTLSINNILPYSTYTPTGFGTGTITLTPGQGDLGTASIGFTATDGYGGSTTTSFSITVTTVSQPPVITPVSDVTTNPVTQSSIVVKATVQSSDILTYTITGLPANSVLAAGPNGVDTIKLNPSYGAAGVYTVIANVKDQHNGSVSDTFHITVNKVAPPSTTIDVQISAGDLAGAPWNAMTSGTISNLKDSKGNTTPVGISFPAGIAWTTFNQGAVTGNNSGVYPDNVEKDYFYFGTYAGIINGPNTVDVKVTGLDPSKVYSMTYFGSSVWGGSADNGTTTFTSQGQTGGVHVQNNTQNTLTFNNLQPAADGSVVFTMGLGANTVLGYLNSIVINNVYDDGTAPLSPSTLTARPVSNGVQLNWYDSAYNETGYEIWRSASATGPFTQVLPGAAAQATSYVDVTAVNGTNYYYEVRAVNTHGISNYSNVASSAVNTNPPTGVSGLTATVVSKGVQLNWVDSATNETGYEVWRATSAAGTYTQLQPNPAPAATAFLDSTVAIGGTFYYKVRAINTFGASAFSTIVNATVASQVNRNPTVISVQMYGGDAAGSPWNIMSGTTITNLKDNNGNTTPVGVAFQGGIAWTAFNGGPATGNNSGVYPDNVEKDYFYFGTWPGIITGPNTVNVKVTGLDTSKICSLTFYSASVWGGQPNNGTTTFSSQGQTGGINVQNNTQNTLTFSGLKPASDGTVTFTMGLGASTTLGYLNAVVVNIPFDDGTAPISPGNSLSAIPVAGQGVQLNWIDSSYNETGFEVWRATQAAGPFTKLSTNAPAQATTYLDGTVGSGVKYYYEVRAVNTHGSSAYSNVASTTSLDKVPVLTAIPDVTMSYGQKDTVQIITNADQTNHVVLTASNLPSFATLTDKGNGTGYIVLAPPAGVTGTFPNLVVTSTDQFDSVRMDSFNVTVTDPLISTTYIHFSDGVHFGNAPWNNVNVWPAAGSGWSNFVDDHNVTTPVSLTYLNGFSGNFVGGMQPGNGAGLYPDAVMVCGVNESANKTDSFKISGLAKNKGYNFVFFNSFDYGGSGTTNFAIQGRTVTLNPDYNISNVARINRVFSDANGNVTINVSKANTSQSFAVLNDLIIEAYDSTSSLLLSPTALRATVLNRTSVSLQWQDRSSNETGFQILRATDSLGSTYKVVATVAASATSYVDANLKANTDYYYVVRAIKGSTLSNNSNAVSATTYAYSIYLSYSSGATAPAPWNNIGVLPTPGFVSSNLLDELGNITQTSQIQTGVWAGLYQAGMQTGNNSGIVPDAVMKNSYGLFPGNSSSLLITGLDLNLSYDFTFFASGNQFGDLSAKYTINGQSAVLNASMNETGEVTIYGVTPDPNGNVSVNIALATPNGIVGLLNAMVISGHNLSALSSAPGSGKQQNVISPNRLTGVAAQLGGQDSVAEKGLEAYPNPFTQSFTLTVPADNNNGRAQVMLYDINGKLVYQKEFDNLTQGDNFLRIDANAGMAHAGVYMVKVVYADKNKTKVIKVIKQ